jgi:hypothetical protein
VVQEFNLVLEETQVNEATAIGSIREDLEALHKSVAPLREVSPLLPCTGRSSQAGDQECGGWPHMQRKAWRREAGRGCTPPKHGSAHPLCA